MPVHIKVGQNTEDWYRLRTGVPTASSFDKILTAVKLEPSTSQTDFLYHLVAESVVGHVLGFKSDAMERGHELEAEAIKAYQLIRNCDTQEGGFWMNDEQTYGASPDRLVGEDGLTETKAPLPHNHIKYHLTPGALSKEYRLQTQGQLLVTGREWVDLISYCPELPLVVERQVRDEVVIQKLRDALDPFCVKLAELKAQFTEQVTA